MRPSRGGYKKMIAEYEIDLRQKLGEGGFGSVYKGYNTLLKEKVAVKFIPKQMTHSSEYKIASLKNQVRLLRAAESKHVVSEKEILVSKNYYYIVQELCDFDLGKFLKKEGPLSQERAIDILSQILCGFYTLIVHGIVHRDLKPVNILFKDGVVKLADFGLARKISKDTKLLETRVGTLSYQSPQVLKGKKYTYKCDVWGIGAVFYELLYNEPLFLGSQQGIMKAHKQIDSLTLPEEPHISEGSKQILRACLKYEQKDRAEWDFLFSHPLLRDKVPQIKHLQQNLNYIISTIRTEVHSQNIDLDKFFDRFRKKGEENLKLQAFCQMILNLIGEDKITIEDMKYTFRYFDQDENGKISVDEFISTLEKHGVSRKALSRSQLNQLSFKNVVSSYRSDDAVTEDQEETYSPEVLDEIRKTETAYQKIITSLFTEKLLQIKQKYDLEDLQGSGLNYQLFSDLLKSICPTLTVQECKLLFKKFDDDKNGKVCFEEFNKYICQISGLSYRLMMKGLHGA